MWNFKFNTGSLKKYTATALCPRMRIVVLLCLQATKDKDSELDGNLPSCTETKEKDSELDENLAGEAPKP